MSLNVVKNDDDLRNSAVMLVSRTTTKIIGENIAIFIDRK